MKCLDCARIQLKPHDIDKSFLQMAGRTARCIGLLVKQRFRPWPGCGERHDQRRSIDCFRKGRGVAPRRDGLDRRPHQSGIEAGRPSSHRKKQPRDFAAFHFECAARLRIDHAGNPASGTAGTPGGPRFGVRRRLFFQSRQAVGNPVSHPLGLGSHSWNGI